MVLHLLSHRHLNSLERLHLRWVAVVVQNLGNCIEMAFERSFLIRCYDKTPRLEIFLIIPHRFYLRY
jgi:hypothetical protein